MYAIIYIPGLSIEIRSARVEKKESKPTAKAKEGGAKSSGAKTMMEVNEGQIDLLLDMIKTADVTSEENQAENATLLELEGEEISQNNPWHPKGPRFCSCQPQLWFLLMLGNFVVTSHTRTHPMYTTCTHTYISWHVG